MACSPTGSSQKRVCVGDCFDVDERGKLQIRFSSAMNNLFSCTDDGLCYSHQYPVRADTFTTQTGCGADGEAGVVVTDFTDCATDGRNFMGAGLKSDQTLSPFPAANAEVNDTTCSPTLDDSVNPTASTNTLSLTNDSCTPWLVEVQTDQFYGFIDNFQPFKPGYARILGEVRWGVDGKFINEWQRVYELARSGNEGASIADTCTDCCNDLPETGGTTAAPTTPRADCVAAANANREQAEAVVRLISFKDRLNTTGGAYRTFVELQPDETLEVQTRARVSATCSQTPDVGSRAGHITMMAMPLVGCSDNSACDDCQCGSC